MLSRLVRIVPKPLRVMMTDHNVWFHTRAHLLTRPLYSGIGSILMFHRVCPRSSCPRLGFNKDLEVTPELLERTVLFFKKKNYKFVSLDEVGAILRNGSHKGKFVAVTFDDGYLDNYTYAYPILKRHQVPFTIYVTTSFPDRKAILWWYVLEELLLNRDEVEVRLGDDVVRYDCSTLAKKESAFSALQSHLTYASDENYGAKLERTLGKSPAELYRTVDELALTWEQIRRLSKDPLVTIGAHTLDHLALSKLSSAEAMRQVAESKLKIESEIGVKVRHFAYPYGGRGAAGSRDFRLVKECGFSTATTTRNGNIFGAHRRHLECLPRIAVNQVELRKNVDYLSLWIDGLIPCHENNFQRVVSI